MNKLVDVHTHLTHPKFEGIFTEIISEINTSMGAVICNGLEPKSNRKILEWSKIYPKILPAIGIYPIDAVNKLLSDDFPIDIVNFNVDDEIEFIRRQASSGNIIAVGECGLDGYWLDQKTFDEQERVFEELICIAKNANIPVIIHTRKLEKRAIEILTHHKITKVNFHCFCGKVKLALKAAENEDWCFSIPASARKNQGFTKLLEQLPLNRILTETDAPFLSPQKGTLNRPINVKDTVKYMAEIRGWDFETCESTIWNNFQRLFGLMKN